MNHLNTIFREGILQPRSGGMVEALEHVAEHDDRCHDAVEEQAEPANPMGHERLHQIEEQGDQE
ncbi:hypothetical protein D3C76_1187810 [compost metagenome]